MHQLHHNHIILYPPFTESYFPLENPTPSLTHLVNQLPHNAIPFTSKGILASVGSVWGPLDGVVEAVLFGDLLNDVYAETLIPIVPRQLIR